MHEITCILSKEGYNMFTVCQGHHSYSKPRSFEFGPIVFEELYVLHLGNESKHWY